MAGFLAPPSPEAVGPATPLAAADDVDGATGPNGEEPYYVPTGSPRHGVASAARPVAHAAASGRTLDEAAYVPGTGGAVGSGRTPVPPPRYGSEAPPALSVDLLPPPPVPSREAYSGSAPFGQTPSALDRPESEIRAVRARLAEGRAAERECEELRKKVAAAMEEVKEARAKEAEIATLQAKAVDMERQLEDVYTQHGQDNYWRIRAAMLEIKLDNADAKNAELEAEKSHYLEELYCGEEPDTKLATRVREIEGDNRRLRKLLEHERDRLEGVTALSASREYLERLNASFAAAASQQSDLFRDAERVLRSVAGPAPAVGAPVIPRAPGAAGDGYWCARCRLFVEAESRGAEPPTRVAKRSADQRGLLPTPYFKEVPGYGPPPPAAPQPTLGLSPGAAGLYRSPPQHPALAPDAGAAASPDRARRTRLGRAVDPPDRVELTHWRPSRSGLVPDFPRGAAWDGAGSIQPPAPTPPPAQPPPPPPQPQAAPPTPPHPGGYASEPEPARSAAVAVYTPRGWRQL